MMTAAHKEEAFETVEYGVVAEFDGPGELIEVAKKVRDEGYTKWDCHSPFPVHGIDPAMGIKPTILPMLVFGGGATGLFLAILMQTWMNAADYPWIVSGKPLFSLPMQMPIIFETTVLLAAFTTFFGMWALNKLPQVWHPLFSRDLFMKASDNGFFVAIEAADPKFDSAGTRRLLEDAGARAVESVRYQTGKAERALPKAVFGLILGSSVAALVPIVLIADARTSTSDEPHYHVVPNMDFQPKYQAQNASDIFADGRADRLPVDGTVARGERRADRHFYQGIVSDGENDTWAQSFPAQVPLTHKTMERGKERFGIYCAPCHGYAGQGDGIVHRRAEAVGATTTGWVAPSNVTQEVYVRQPHGLLFNTITHGVRSMPGYASQIGAVDRWAIIFYVRALQRAANATVDDVPSEQRSAIR